MKILGYKGRSIFSKLIKIQTRSDFSHVAILLSDGTVIEAWALLGVRHVASPTEAHKFGTVIETFNIDSEYNELAVMGFLKSQLGKRYDYRGIIRFLSRRNSQVNNKWFCSELVMEAFRRGGLDLQERIPSSYATPRDIVISPHLSGPISQ